MKCFNPKNQIHRIAFIIPFVYRCIRQFSLRTYASCNTWCSREFNTQLPRVIAERTIHHVIVMDGRSFGQSQWKLLVDKLNHTHWLRMASNVLHSPSLHLSTSSHQGSIDIYSYSSLISSLHLITSSSFTLLTFLQTYLTWLSFTGYLSRPSTNMDKALKLLLMIFFFLYLKSVWEHLSKRSSSRSAWEVGPTHLYTPPTSHQNHARSSSITGYKRR